MATIVWLGYDVIKLSRCRFDNLNQRVASDLFGILSGDCLACL